MADYVLSNAAGADLDDIYVYSFETFGEARADAYFLSLRDCLQTLAETSRMGQDASALHAGLLRHHHARHVVYYLIEDGGIFVVRVLHDAMDAPRHVCAPQER